MDQHFAPDTDFFCTEYHPIPNPDLILSLAEINFASEKRKWSFNFFLFCVSRIMKRNKLVPSLSLLIPFYIAQLVLMFNPSNILFYSICCLTWGPLHLYNTKQPPKLQGCLECNCHDGRQGTSTSDTISYFFPSFIELYILPPTESQL